MWHYWLIPIAVILMIAAYALLKGKKVRSEEPRQLSLGVSTQSRAEPQLDQEPQNYPTPTHRSSGDTVPGRWGTGGMNIRSSASGSAGVDVQINGVSQVTSEEDTLNLILKDASDNTVTPTAVDTATAGEVTATLPYISLNTDFEVDEINPTVGEEIAFTDLTNETPDHWGWALGDDTFSAVKNPTKTYLIPGVYDVHLQSIDSALPASGSKEKVNYITAAGIFDTYTTAHGHFAPVLLEREYAGDWGRVRESSGNTTDEIGFSSGELDQSALLAHTGANNGFAERIYIHDGSGRYWNQTTNANQPQIVSSGAIIENGLRPSLRFNGTTQFMSMTDFAYWGGDRTKICLFAVIKPTSTTSASNYIMGHWIASGNQRSWAMLHDGTTNKLGVRFTTDGTSGTDQLQYFNSLTAEDFCLVSAQINTSEASAIDRIKAWKNRSTMTSGAPTGNSTGNLHDSTGNLNLAAINNGAGWYEGDILFAGFIPSLLSDANRGAVEQYLMDYFNIN